MDRINAWKAACTALLGALTALWGWMGWLVVGWVGLMGLDYLTGTGAAMKEGNWSSKAKRSFSNSENRYFSCVLSNTLS